MKRFFTLNRGVSLLKKVVMYALLISIGFVFLYPFLYMFINSFMSPEDLMNPAVSWVPTKIYFENYVKAFQTLDFGPSFWNSLYISVIAALLQTAVVRVFLTDSRNQTNENRLSHIYSNRIKSAHWCFLKQ